MKTEKRQHPALHIVATLCARAPEIVERHRAEPAIAVFARTLPPKNARFEQAYQRLHQLESERTAQLTERTLRLRELKASMAGWLPHVVIGTTVKLRDVQSAESRAIDALPLNAQDLIACITRHHGGTQLERDALADLEPKLELARRLMDAVNTLHAHVQNAQRELRAAATDVHQELNKLRAVARITLGPRHKDTLLLQIPRKRLAADANPQAA